MRGKNIENEFEKILKKDVDGKLTTLKIKESSLKMISRKNIFRSL